MNYRIIRTTTEVVGSYEGTKEDANKMVEDYWNSEVGSEFKWEEVEE